MNIMNHTEELQEATVEFAGLVWVNSGMMLMVDPEECYRTDMPDHQLRPHLTKEFDDCRDVVADFEAANAVGEHEGQSLDTLGGVVIPVTEGLPAFYPVFYRRAADGRVKDIMIDLEGAWNPEDEDDD
jgi:hypothetical protein